MQGGGVPGGEDDSAVGGVMDDSMDDVLELVYTLAGIVMIGSQIGSAEMTPLEAVHGAEGADGIMAQPHRIQELPGAIRVPYLHPFPL